MHPGEAGALVRSHHDELRRGLDKLAALARDVVRGKHHCVAELLHRAHRVCEQLGVHAAFEEQVLAPFLPEVQADRLHRHRQRRTRLSNALSAARERDADPVERARHMASLVRVLREEMDQEERYLSPNLLGSLEYDARWAVAGGAR